MKFGNREIEYIKKYKLKKIEAIEPINIDSIKPIIGGTEDKFFYSINANNNKFKVEKKFEIKFKTVKQEYEVIGVQLENMKMGYQPGILYIKIKTGYINRIYQILVHGDIFENFLREVFVSCQYSSLKHDPIHINNMFINFFNVATKCGYYFPANNIDSKIWREIKLKSNWEVHNLPAYIDDFYKNYKCYNAIYITDKETGEKHYGFIDAFINNSFREDLSTIICWHLKYNIFDDSIYFREYFTPNDHVFNNDENFTKTDFSLLPREELENFINIYEGLKLSSYGKYLFKIEK